MKITKTSRDVTNYIKMRGIIAILEECNNNINEFKEHLRRVLNLDSSVNLYLIGKEAEKILSESVNKEDVFEILVDKFLQDNFGGLNG